VKEILLIEDSPPDADLVTRALKEEGIANPIRWIRDGSEALRCLQDVELLAAIGPPVPSILLVDLKLPGLSGFEILENIQGKPAFRGMLRIVLSNLGDLENIKRAYRCGAHSFLTKPVQSENLRELIVAFPGNWSFTGSAGPCVTDATT
jgi:CheY-like chemotaxis protein